MFSKWRIDDMIQLYSDQLEFKIYRDYNHWNPDFHMHNFYEIFFLRQGNIDFYMNNTKRHIVPGTMVFITDQDIHKSILISDDIYERAFIHIPPALITSCSSPLTNLSGCFHSSFGQFFQLSQKQGDLFFNTVQNMIHLEKNKEFGHDIMIHSELLKILVSANSLCQSNTENQFSEQYSRRICDMIHYIEEHLSENLTLESIAKHFSIDKYHLCHIFKTETNSTVYHYIQLKRIALAKRLLAEGRSLTEVCFDAGFNDYNHFITTFKKHSGMTPKKYVQTSCTNIQ